MLDLGPLTTVGNLVSTSRQINPSGSHFLIPHSSPSDDFVFPWVLTLHAEKVSTLRRL